jgi:hypothetical protein
VRDENGDGRIDVHDEQRTATDRATGGVTAERDADRAYSDVDRTPAVVPAGPRPRASLFVTLGLITGVIAALAVLSGTLAGYGLALGVLGLLFSLAGLSATSRRHIAGRSDALIGLLLSLGAVVFGALALTGSLSWLTTETDHVGQLREWLDTNIANRF